jgi:predicted TIM-barrel fold metal-dependent hydrolase
MRLPFFDADVMLGDTFPPLPAPLRDTRGLLDEMDRFGIERALFFHHVFSADGAAQMNAATLADAKASPRLAPCWILHTSPETVGESLKTEAERIVSSGARAVRLFPEEGPAASPVPLRPYLIGKILAGLERYRIPLLVPESLLNVAQLGSGAYDPIEQFCSVFPRLPIVVLAPRYNSAPLLVPLMRRHPNLHATITLFGLFRELEGLVAMVGPERFLFATGLPHFDASIAAGMLLYSSLPPETLETIAGGNLQRLLANAGREGE